MGQKEREKLFREGPLLMASDLEIDQHIYHWVIYSKIKHWIGQNGAFKERKDEQ